MSIAFVDSAAFIALANRDDGLHDQALTELARLQRLKVQLITTEFILVEVADALCGQRYRHRIIPYVERIQTLAQLETIAASSELISSGWELYKARSDKEWSLTDCISFTVMQERGIRDAFTSDRHFAQGGFTVLLSTTEP